MAAFKIYDGTNWVELLKSSDISAWAKAASKPTYTYSEVGAAAAHHLYHTWDNNTNYYDSYEGGNMFRIITENMYADLFRFQASTVANLEYHNGSSWVAWSFDLSNLFDGNARTGVSIPYANRKFRFTMRTNGGWPTTGMFMLQGTWFSDGGWPNGQKSDIIIETRASTSASWTQRATFTLSGVQGMAGHTLSSLHTGDTYYRITITIYPWTTTSNNCPLQRLCLFSNYNGGALEKITHDGNGNVTIPTLKSTTIYENGTALSSKYAAKSHTHTKSEITDFPTSMPASDVSAWAKAATKPSYTHNEIGAGNLTIGDGTNTLFFRTNASWASAIYHQTSSDEAVVFLNNGKEVGGTANYSTSWIFAYGTPSDRPAWTGLTPAMQIKGNSVVINKLLGSKVGASYNLDVNGTLNATTIYQNGTALSAVATSGSYNDLSNKPTIPSVSNATITIKQAGRTDQTFTLNGSATTINLDNTTYSAASTTANGLMSSTDKSRLDSIWNVWSADGTNDTLVNKVEEVLTAFNNFPEANNLVDLLAAKVPTSRKVNGHALTGDISVTASDVGLGNVKNQAITVTSTSVSDGTNTFNKYTHPTKTAVAASAKKVGYDSTGHVVLGAALTAADVGARSSSWMPTAAQVGALPTGTTLDSIADGSTRKLSNYVPYTGATKEVNIGDNAIKANSFLSQGQSMNPNSGITFYEGDTTLNSDASLNLQGTDVYLNANGEGGKAYYNGEEIATQSWVTGRNYLTDITSSMVTTALGYTPGTSNFTGYTSSNKLHTNYINNAAGWTSNKGTVTSVKLGSTAYSPNTSGVVSLPAYPTKSSWNYDDAYIKLSGSSSITGDLTPSTAGSYSAGISLGSSSKPWKYLYAYWINAGGIEVDNTATGTYTIYSDGAIVGGTIGNSPAIVLTLPAASGTLALTSNIKKYYRHKIYLKPDNSSTARVVFEFISTRWNAYTLETLLADMYGWSSTNKTGTKHSYVTMLETENRYTSSTNWNYSKTITGESYIEYNFTSGDQYVEMHRVGMQYYNCRASSSTAYDKVYTVDTYNYMYFGSDTVEEI